MQDRARGVVIDQEGDVYVGGTTWGDVDGNSSAGMEDVVLAKFSGDGSKYWTRQYGAEYSDEFRGIAVDSRDRIYISGQTGHVLENVEILLMRVDADGEMELNEAFGTEEHDDGQAIAVDGSDHVYIVGGTYGALDGEHAGVADLFVMRVCE